MAIFLGEVIPKDRGRYYLAENPVLFIDLFCGTGGLDVGFVGVISGR